MNVQVRHLLPRVLAIVDHQPIAQFGQPQLCGDGRCFYEQMAQHGMVCCFRILQLANGFTGNDQHMSGGHGLNVHEGDNVFVLIDDVGGNLAGYDAFEDGFAHTRLMAQPSRSVTPFIRF